MYLKNKMKNLIVFDFWGQFRPEAVVWKNKLMKTLVCVWLSGLFCHFFLWFFFFFFISFFLYHCGVFSTCTSALEVISKKIRCIALGQMPPMIVEGVVNVWRPYTSNPLATHLKKILLLNCHCCICVPPFPVCRERFSPIIWLSLLWCTLHYLV